VTPRQALRVFGFALAGWGLVAALLVAVLWLAAGCASPIANSAVDLPALEHEGWTRATCNAVSETDACCWYTLPPRWVAVCTIDAGDSWRIAARGEMTEPAPAAPDESSL
jgi:hypothetical protein